MHAIRLRRPWSKRVVSGDVADAGDGKRVDVPDEVADVGSARVEYERRFNRPTGIDGATRVWLELSGWSGRLREVRLNDERLDPGPSHDDILNDERPEFERSPLRVDASEKVAAHNRLVVTLERSGDQPPRLSGEVRLLIGETPDSTAGR